MQDHPDFQHRANVVGLYGDDCRYNNVGEKLLVVCMNLILQEPARRLVRKKGGKRFLAAGLDLCRYPIFVLRQFLQIHGYTLDPVFHLIRWSMNDAWLRDSVSCPSPGAQYGSAST